MFTLPPAYNKINVCPIPSLFKSGVITSSQPSQKMLEEQLLIIHDKIRYDLVRLMSKETEQTKKLNKLRIQLKNLIQYKNTVQQEDQIDKLEIKFKQTHNMLEYCKKDIFKRSNDTSVCRVELTDEIYHVKANENLFKIQEKLDQELIQHQNELDTLEKEIILKQTQPFQPVQSDEPPKKKQQIDKLYDDLATIRSHIEQLNKLFANIYKNIHELE